MIWFCRQFRLSDSRKTLQSAFEHILWNKNSIFYESREKVEDLIKSYVKATTQNPHKNYDYTTIADRLRRDNWSNHSHKIGVVKSVYGISAFQLTTKTV